MVDVVKLIDEQLAAGERGGRCELCPHCDRHWHGLPVTERIAEMYAVGIYEPDYRVDTDDTPVLCQGSDFIGPMPLDPLSTCFTRSTAADFAAFLDVSMREVLAEADRTLIRVYERTIYVWWFCLGANLVGFIVGVEPLWTHRGHFGYTTGANLLMTVFSVRMLINNRRTLHELRQEST
jgi:hypothetical protein